jgi:anti-sigma-K factor RskA
MTARTYPPNLAHALAGEYVLGTLRGRARQRFAAACAADPALAAIVSRWEEGLTPLALGVSPIEPPARVWRAIEARIAPSAAAQQPASAVLAQAGSFWSSLGFWRAFGTLAGGLATVLLAAFLWVGRAPAGDPMFVAVLAAQDSVPRAVVSMHPRGLLEVRMVKPWPRAGEHALELWAVSRDGAPRSLGMVRNEMGNTMIHVKMSDPRMQGITAIALSLEPPGGSPQATPSGPVLCSGMVAGLHT